MWCRLSLGQLLLILSFAKIDAKEPELPLCPTNMQYFPQSLPMHCRLPGTVPPFPAPVYQNPELGKQPLPMPVPLPGMPIPMPGGMPMPMPMPPPPPPKVPVIVMPFYSPDTSGKNPHTYIPHPGKPRKHKLPRRRRKPKYYNSDEDSTDTDSSTDTDDSSETSSERGFWRGPRSGRRSNRHHNSKRNKQQQHKDLLTPILQYVTKDGYVIFEKQISKGEAKDWLVSKSENKENNAVQITPTKIEDDANERDTNEPRQDRGTRLSLRDGGEIEVKTELNPNIAHKKKNYKRKVSRKKSEQ